jgi:hypothetical protein
MQTQAEFISRDILKEAKISIAHYYERKKRVHKNKKARLQNPKIKQKCQMSRTVEIHFHIKNEAFKSRDMFRLFCRRDSGAHPLSHITG